MSIQHTQVIDCSDQKALHPTQVKSSSIDNHHCSGRLSRTLLASAVALALCGPGLVGSSQAATISVSGGCSLVDAINSANDDDSISGCVDGAGADTIVLQNSSSHDYNSSNYNLYGFNALPFITSQITIEGNGATIRRTNGFTSGSTKFRLIHVDPNGNLTLNDTIISGGWANGGNPNERNGGGILNRGQLSLDNCTLLNNSASSYGGGLASRFGTASITNSTVSSNGADSGGGGIYNGYGTLFITDSTLSGNGTGLFGAAFNARGGTSTFDNTLIANNESSQDGGAISSYLNGTIVNINNSTLSSNQASNRGGAIRIGNNTTLNLNQSTVSGNSALQAGGAIFIEGIANVSNSTVSDNYSGTVGSGFGGGAIYNSNNLYLVNTTLSGNISTGGVTASGLLNDGYAKLSNTILANGVGGSDCVIVAATGSISVDNHNIIQDNASCLGTAISIDPLLGVLKNNGGTTQTHALLAGSPAINAGDDAICNAVPVNNRDQRGRTRPSGLGCDIGAFEFDEDGFIVIPLPAQKVVVIPSG